MVDMHEVFEDDEVEQIFELLSESDEDVKCGGSKPGRAASIDRDCASESKSLFEDFFSRNATYSDHMFSRCYRVSKIIFLTICEKLESRCGFFQQRTDGAGLKDFEIYQKCTSALRLLAYGLSGSDLVLYLKMGESAAQTFLNNFAEGVVECFKDHYLKPPNEDQKRTLLQRAKALGFTGMIGSIDCCEWTWKNCPTACHGQYESKEKYLQ